MELRTIVVGPLQTNCYVLWEDPKAAVVVDPGDEPERIAKALDAEGVEPQLILSTHGHFDHVGGVDGLRRRFGAQYKIHQAELPILSMVPAGTKLWGITVPPIPKATEFVKDNEAFDLKGLRFSALHTPGHTPGSTCFHVPSEDLVLTGDTLFLQSIGRTDFPGGDHAEILSSIRARLFTLPPETRVLPGHGPESTIEDEAATNPFLV